MKASCVAAAGVLAMGALAACAPPRDAGPPRGGDPLARWWCPAVEKFYPDVRECPGGWLEMSSPDPRPAKPPGS